MSSYLWVYLYGSNISHTRMSLQVAYYIDQIMSLPVSISWLVYMCA